MIKFVTNPSQFFSYLFQISNLDLEPGGSNIILRARTRAAPTAIGKAGTVANSILVNSILVNCTDKMKIKFNFNLHKLDGSSSITNC